MGLLRLDNTKAGAIAWFGLETEDEVDAYKKLLECDMPTCPHCGKSYSPPKGNMLIKVIDPLNKMIGMNLGQFVTKCNKCGKEITLPAQVDVTYFKSAMNWIEDARKKYASTGAKKGGTASRG